MVPANKRIIRNGFSCLPFWDQLWGALRHAGRTLRKKRNTGRKSKVWCREVPAHSSFNINWINIWRSFHLEVDVCRMPTASPGVGLRPSRSEYAQGVQGANGCGDHVDFCSRKKNHRENWNVSNWCMMFRWWALHWLWGFCNELHPIGPPWHCDSKNFGRGFQHFGDATSLVLHGFARRLQGHYNFHINRLAWHMVFPHFQHYKIGEFLFVWLLSLWLSCVKCEEPAPLWTFERVIPLRWSLPICRFCNEPLYRPEVP